MEVLFFLALIVGVPYLLYVVCSASRVHRAYRRDLKRRDSSKYYNVRDIEPISRKRD